MRKVLGDKFSSLCVSTGISKDLNRQGSVETSKSKYNELYPQYTFKQESILRIIDANLNRCREGLRVVEDSLRFVLNDGILYKKIREVRHNVDEILRNIYKDLIKKRDTLIDSGRQIPEISKRELSDVVIANFKRVQESLRVLEEYSKTFLPEVSAVFKKQRYVVYTLEKEVYLKYKIVFYSM
ncbi:MAG: hypothetical protein LBB92_01120 [Endomicrobium sp.]|jgi:thiamine-phosphate pyrophosphorylase|nr:hypothetical protein [Endomicrobium sp.]